MGVKKKTKKKFIKYELQKLQLKKHSDTQVSKKNKRVIVHPNVNM